MKYNMLVKPKVGQKVKFIVKGWKDFYNKSGIIVRITSGYRPITIRFSSPVRLSYTWDCDAAELVLLSGNEEKIFNKELSFCRQEMAKKICYL